MRYIRWIVIILTATFVFAEPPIIKIVSPIDDDPVIANKELTIIGELKNGNKLTVNGYKVQLERGMFRLKFKLTETGYREFVFKAENDSGRSEKKINVVSLETFPDIKNSQYQREIEAATTLKYTHSYMGTDFFRPRSYVRKSDMARLMLILKGIPATTQSNHHFEFKDVPASHWAAPYIQLVLDNNLMSPMSPVDFGPNRMMTRQEVLSLLRQFYRFQKEENRSYYKDLNLDNGEDRWISALAAQGALPLAWLQTDTFFPNRPVMRGELAAILCRMESVSSQIKDRFGFEFRRHRKSASLAGLFNQMDISFRPIATDVFAVDCTPGKERKPMFIELQLIGDNNKKTVLLMDDGQGVDQINGDRVYSGVINLSKFQTNTYQYIYKLFDDYNLIYKVGEGKIRNEKGTLVAS